MPHAERDDSCKATIMDDIPEDNLRRNLHTNCDAAQIMFERVAWAEAGILAHAFSKSYSVPVSYVYIKLTLFKINGCPMAISRMPWICTRLA